LRIPHNDVRLPASLLWPVHHPTAYLEAFGKNLAKINPLEFFAVTPDEARMFAHG
jgi:hypothetical protein